MAHHLSPSAVAFSLLVGSAALAGPDRAAANAPPEPSDVDLDATEDTSATLNLKATDPDGNTVTFRLLKGPKSGEATLTSSGQLIYTPKPDFHGDVVDHVAIEKEPRCVRRQLAPTSVWQ